MRAVSPNLGLGILFWGTALCFSQFFSQIFFIPKLLFLLTALSIGLATGIFFKSSPVNLKIPRSVFYFFAAWFIYLIFHFLIQAQDWVSWLPMASLYLAGLICFLVFINLEQTQTDFLWDQIIWIAVAQAVWILIYKWGVTPLPFQTFFGNEEFAATWIGVAAIVLFQKLEKKNPPRLNFFWAMNLGLLILAALLLHNKGTLIFLVLLGVWQKFKISKWVWIAAAPVFVAAFLFSIKTRMILWLVAVFEMLRYPWGVGLGHYGNYYLETLSLLFGQYPFLQERFGTFSANVLQAHQLILHWGAEWGLPGLFFPIMIYILFFRALKQKNTKIYFPAFVFLMIKASYTVVLESLTGIMLFAFVFSQSIRLSTKNILVSYGFFKWMAAFLMTVCLLGNYFYVVSDFYYQRGINSLMRNEKNISKIFFENSFENNKNNWDAALALAFLAFDQKDEIRMNQYLEKALSIRQDINTVKISSQMWFKIGSEKAIPGYKLLTRVFPEHLTPWAHLAQMAFKQKRYKEARQYAEHILKIQPRLKSTSYDFNRQVAHDILRSIPNSSVIKEPL